MIALPSPNALSAEDLHLLLENLDTLTPAEQRAVLDAADALVQETYRQRCHDDLIAFCVHMQSDYKVGAHHKALAKLLTGVANGEEDRICVNIAPRHGKSQLTSLYFPAWYLGRNPQHKVILVSHTADLAVDFGRKVRNVIASPEYRQIFPGIVLSKDSKSAGRWNTNAGGEFYATGVGSSLAGRGAHLLVIDDPHSEQDVLAGRYEVFDKAYSWFAFGARTRLMSKGRVAVVQTRWHSEDLTGRLVKAMADPVADQYKVVEFPAILHEGTDNEKALWPEFFPLDVLNRTKASMPRFQWNAQFQQNPTGESAAIIRRDSWKRWAAPRTPVCDYIIMALDAAAEANNRADFTAITTWGVFQNEKDACTNIILLNAIKERVEFPELKERALKEYKSWEPDAFIVEKKSSGTALYQELRRIGIVVQEYTPVRGTINNPNTKMARLNSVADIVRSGLVWAPETRWADDLIEEVASFPNAPNDDLVDTMIMALMRFRQGGFIRLPTDEKDVPFSRMRIPSRGESAYY